MSLFSEAKISPAGKVNAEDLKKWAMNIVVFTAPALAVFFGQLAMGVAPKEASLVALLALYGVLADLFKKFTEGK